MAELETLTGILALVDIVNYTPQAQKMGDDYAAQYCDYFQQKIKTYSAAHGFRLIETLGDAVLLFGTD